MGLKNLFGWNQKEKAQAVSACGSTCGAGQPARSPKPAEPKPTACGSACGAGDKK